MKRTVDLLDEQFKTTIDKLERKTKLSADEKEELRWAKVFSIPQTMGKAAGAGR